MTPDEIYDRVVGELEGHCASHTDMHGSIYKALYRRAWVRAITEAVAAERERCACIVDAMEVVVEDFGVREYTAAAIRKGS